MKTRVSHIIKIMLFLAFATFVSFLSSTIFIKNSGYTGSIKPAGLLDVEAQSQAEPVKDINRFWQEGDTTCGPASIRYLLARYGTDYSEEEIRNLVPSVNGGASMLGLAQALDKLGFTGNGLKLDIEKLEKVHTPFIAFVNNNHFVTVYYVDSDKICLFDPAPGKGNTVYGKEQFNKIWNGIVLEVRPKKLDISK
ncbi:MAG TPA: cysteine peptidase family C39 domain-containing protein [Clostridia bacterium]